MNNAVRKSKTSIYYCSSKDKNFHLLAHLLIQFARQKLPCTNAVPWEEMYPALQYIICPPPPQINVVEYLIQEVIFHLANQHKNCHRICMPIDNDSCTKASASALNPVLYHICIRFITWSYQYSLVYLGKNVSSSTKYYLPPSPPQINVAIEY